MPRLRERGVIQDEGSYSLRSLINGIA
jgi:hypothetical protein